MKKYHHLPLPAALLTFTLLYICACGEQNAPEKTRRPVKVETVRSLERTEKTFSGIVTADQFSDLAFKSQGLVVRMHVTEGQHVAKGSVVAEIDPTDFLLSVDDKSARLQKATAEKERAQRLLDKDAISQQEYENALMEYTNARIALENAQNILADTKLKAPFNGFIQKKYVENYQRVQPGEPVVCLINPQLLQIVTTVPETSVDFITSPSDVEVEFDAYKGTRFKAHIKRYVEASPDGAGIPVYISIDDHGFDLSTLRISVGFACKVHIGKEDTALKGKHGVPLSAIVFDNNTKSTSVYVYDSTTQTVRRRTVTDQGVIAERGLVIIDGNVEQGDLVVTAGATLLNDGDSVVIRN